MAANWAQFDLLRAEGQSIKQAAEAIGVSESAANQHVRKLKSSPASGAVVKASQPGPPTIEPPANSVTPMTPKSSDPISALKQKAANINATTDARQQVVQQSSIGPAIEGPINFNKPAPAHEFSALFTLIQQLERRISYLEYMFKKGATVRQDRPLAPGESEHEDVA